MRRSTRTLKLLNRALPFATPIKGNSSVARRTSASPGIASNQIMTQLPCTKVPCKGRVLMQPMKRDPYGSPLGSRLASRRPHRRSRLSGDDVRPKRTRDPCSSSGPIESLHRQAGFSFRFALGFFPWPRPRGHTFRGHASCS